MDETSTLERRLFGYVDVDSGTLLVGDPTYVLPEASEGTPGLDYQLVIDAPRSHAVELGGQPVLLIGNFGGDGTYPVIGEFEDGLLVRVTIEFVEPDE